MAKKDKYLVGLDIGSSKTAVLIAEVEGELVVVVVFVVEEVCAAAHVAHAVRTRIIVNFFMFSVLVVSSGYILRFPFLRAGAPARIRKKASIRRPFWLIFDVSYLRILRRNQAPSPIEPPPRSVSRGSGEAVCGIPLPPGLRESDRLPKTQVRNCGTGFRGARNLLRARNRR